MVIQRTEVQRMMLNVANGSDPYKMADKIIELMQHEHKYTQWDSQSRADDKGDYDMVFVCEKCGRAKTFHHNLYV